MSKKIISSKIVDYIFAESDILAQALSFLSIVTVFNSSKSDSLQFLASRGLIRNENICPKCSREMKLIACKSFNDGFRWACRKPCRGILGIRIGSFLEELK